MIKSCSYSSENLVNALPFEDMLENRRIKSVSTEELLVTVITPTYNQGEFIEATIQSVVSQKYKNIEYIIIDNNSGDGTEEIVKEYQRNHGNIKYIRENDFGQADALNKGFELARGSIVCWLNSDDFYYNDTVIENIVDIFKVHNDVDVVYGNGYCCDKDGEILYPHIINNKQLSQKHFNILCPILQPSSFWRANETRLRKEYTYGFDWIFFRELFTAGKRFFYFNEYLAVYRMYDSNKTGSDSWKRRKELYGIIRNNLGKYHIVTFGYYLICFAYWFSKKTGFRWIQHIVKIISKYIGRRI